MIDAVQTHINRAAQSDDTYIYVQFALDRLRARTEKRAECVSRNYKIISIDKRYI